jgi:predicted aldo/keto reductase-like oxidoreductase
MYAEAYKNMELSRATYREVPVIASASKCLDCQTCVARCINRLDIPAKMARARKILV